MRRLAIFLSVLFVIAMGVASGQAQELGKDSKNSKNDKNDSIKGAAGLAEKMAEHLSRTLPHQLSQLKAGTKSNSASPTETRPQSPKRGSDISVDLAGGQEQGQTDRPKVILPGDKPLGAAGPSRDKKPEGEDPEFMTVEDRWRIGVPDDERFRKGSIFNPYRQNVLKGDYPIIGNDIFLNMTFISESRFDLRSTPIGQNPKNSQLPSSEFFGRGRVQAFNQNFTMSFDMFKGDASFQPVNWRFKVVGIANINLLNSRETTVINLNPQFGRSRLDGFNSIEEAFFEKRMGDTTRIFPFLRGKDSRGGRSPEFDFTSMRVGIQEFNNDFRGFLFLDKNLGARMFGTVRSNRYQYNLAYFNLLEKETNSGLNTSNFRKARFRDQQLYFANVYRQDTFVKGYTLQGSLSYNFDQGTNQTLDANGIPDYRFFDENNLQVRPALLGDARPHRIRVGYFGVAGDGHFGRLNITHQFYQAIGRDEFNGLAARFDKNRGVIGEQRINAQMAAAEVSIDFDYIRYRVAAFYTSGDANPKDGTARGFDAIQDNPVFAGGQFSFFNSVGLRARNTGVAVVEPNSLIPSLRSSKIQGQANFVNPGITVYNAGVDVDLTPKLRGFLNYNNVRFVHTEPLELALFQSGIRKELGHDVGLGFIYRPLLNENIVVTSGASALRGGPGFVDLFTSNCDGVPLGCGARRSTPFSFFTKLKFQY